MPSFHAEESQYHQKLKNTAQKIVLDVRSIIPLMEEVGANGFIWEEPKFDLRINLKPKAK